MKTYKDIFEEIISLENLFLAWDNFKEGKRKKADVLKFEWELERNIFQLREELRSRTYKHQSYSSFYIRDPKQRHIHKAEVKDRVLHHAIFSVLSPIFEQSFISHSFSCRIGKGTHKGVTALEKMIEKESKNYSRPCFVLKCDIKKFFDTVDHAILLRILFKRIKDENVRWLLKEIVESFSSDQSDIFSSRGVPIGNLTSQLFANVYMNELDQFVKHELKIKHYARYTDDFVIVSNSQEFLSNILNPVGRFIEEKLSLKLHPGKVSIRKCKQGIDFLGYVTLPHCRALRTKTKKRIFKKLQERILEYKASKRNEKSLNQCLQSYLGVLSHADAYDLEQELLNQYWFWLK
ncbi:MAG: reverse transcriptase domain-containing protein [Parcubacteria group bacterium]|jgi:retron-type reverse transcriptase